MLAQQFLPGHDAMVSIEPYARLGSSSTAGVLATRTSGPALLGGSRKDSAKIEGNLQRGVNPHALLFRASATLPNCSG
jgi:hypothetical protein